MGTESMYPSIIEVPSIVLAYNMLMNGVYRFDQLRASHETERKEMRVTMSILTFLLDAIIINEYALYRTIPVEEGEGRFSLREFKRQIAESLVRPEISNTEGFHTETN